MISLDEAVNMAARDLPTGWRIVLSIEREGYGVNLVDPFGDEQVVDLDSEYGIPGEIDDLLRIAKDLSKVDLVQ